MKDSRELCENMDDNDDDDNDDDDDDHDDDGNDDDDDDDDEEADFHVKVSCWNTLKHFCMSILLS